jgi:hypothetical protein
VGKYTLIEKWEEIRVEMSSVGNKVMEDEEENWNWLPT